MIANQMKNILLAGWLLISINLTASSHFRDLKTMSIPEGLNNNTIYDIIRDQRGFIWLSTDMGISRYDGFHFRNFPFTKDNTINQAGTIHTVSKIYSDSNGLLYLQQSQGGLLCFDNTKEQFLSVKFSRPMESEKINSLYMVDKQVLYIATTRGLYSAKIKWDDSNKQKNIQVELSESPILKGNISDLCSDDQGNLFLVQNQNSIVHYSMGTRQTQLINTSKKAQTQISCLYVKDDYLWICRKWENPVCYNFKRGVDKTLVNGNETGDLNFSNTYITGITQVDDKNYYLSTWNGLYRMTFMSTNLVESPVTVDHITQNEQLNRTSVETKMTDLLWDDEQNVLWAGTFGGGVVKMSFNKDVYNRLSRRINADPIGIEEDSKGYVWLTTQRKGVWRTTTNSLTVESEFAPWTKGVSTSETYLMYKDKDGCFWLGDEQSGIVYINPLTEDTKYYQIAPANTKDFSGITRQFCLDSRERLWIVTTQGVVLFDTQTLKSQLVFKTDNQVKEVFTVIEDKEGDIWLGTDVGLKRMEVQNGTAKLLGDYEQQAGLEHDAVSSIYVNSYNQIFASYRGKVIRIDGREKNKVESVFTLANGLKTGHIFCMIDDNNGNTWIGSNSGIMTMRNDRTFFYNYSETGYCSAVCRLRDGRLLWADSWGLFYFDPLIVKNHKSKKDLLLSDLCINGKSVVVDEKVNGRVILSSTPDQQKEFVFDIANNDLSFYFSDLQYGMMQQKLAYRLLPDEEWKIGSLQDGVHYNHLENGKYRLQAKLIYPDASEGETMEIAIAINQHWWCTTGAFIVYFLLFIGLCIAVYYYLSQKEKKKRNVHNENSSSEGTNLTKLIQDGDHSKKINDMQRILFMRMMQEMRMPLSMIISPLRELLQEKELSKGLSTKVLVAYRNSMGIQNACDNFFDLYAFTPSTKQVKLARYSIVKVIDAFVFSMNEFLRVHPIQLQYEKKVQKDFEVWISKKEIELILHNLLYNAFIHIQYSGVVALIVRELIEGDKHYCVISVVDNGKNEVKTVEEISADREELMQVNYASVQLGLSFMEEIMKEHHGGISLTNLEKRGTKVQIKWPIDKAEFEQDENVIFVESEKQKDVVLSEGSILIKTLDEEEEEELIIKTDGQKLPVERAKKTILIVEDYNDIRFYLKTLFENEYNILIAINGKEGVEMAQKELPDLVLCDVMMPVKDGFECCKEIKEGLDTCHIPVIMLTAKVEEEDIIKGLEIGADDYILKPFIPQILKVKVRNVIEGRVNLKKMYTKLLVTPPEENAVTQLDQVKEVEFEDPFISIVVKIIEENIQEPDFNVKRLASDLNMSQPTLYRRVKQCTDFTIIELIRGVRMKKAATLLIKKLYPVQEVAEMVGYNDIPTFRKHFVDTYGTTPSTYAGSNL